jgi:ribosomal-protein-alanine N-acetyltransferase
MEFTFSLMDEAAARAVQGWRYAGEYAVYNMGSDGDPDDVSELLDRRSPYYAVRAAGDELIGYFAFGTACGIDDYEPPALYRTEGVLNVGLGLRPDLTGQGLGLAFVNAGLAFARRQFALVQFRLFVLPLNERAIRVYEQAGFRRVGMAMQHSPQGERPFLEMRRQP